MAVVSNKYVLKAPEGPALPWHCSGYSRQKTAVKGKSREGEGSGC